MWEIEFKKMYEDGGEYMVFDVDPFSIDVIMATSGILSDSNTISRARVQEMLSGEFEDQDEWGEIPSDEVLEAIKDRLLDMGWDRLEGFILDELDSYISKEDNGDEFYELVTYPGTISALAKEFPEAGIEGEGLILVKYVDDGGIVLNIYVPWFNYGFVSAVEINGELKFKIVYDNPEY